MRVRFFGKIPLEFFKKKGVHGGQGVCQRLSAQRLELTVLSTDVQVATATVQLYVLLYSCLYEFKEWPTVEKKKKDTEKRSGWAWLILDRRRDLINDRPSRATAAEALLDGAQERYHFAFRFWNLEQY